MRSSRKIFMLLLGLLCLVTSATYTFSYFTINEKVEDSINLSIGNIDSSFIKIDDKTPYKSAVVDIRELMTEASKEHEFLIKNTGSLTSKMAVYFSDFSGDGVDYVLPYLSYKLEIGGKSFSGSFKDLYSEKKYFEAKNNENPILFKSGDTIKVKITFKLNKNTPYSAENKTLKFNMNIIAAQPNDASWLN